MAKTYTLNVAGLTRELTICKVNDHMDIAAFIMLGDAELTPLLTFSLSALRRLRYTDDSNIL